MGCGGCSGARNQFWSGVRTGNIRAAGQGIQRGMAVISEKIRGTYDERKYVQHESAAPPATPYRRPPERTS